MDTGSSSVLFCWLFFVLSRHSGEKKVHPPAPAAAASCFFKLVKMVFYSKYLINHIQALCSRGLPSFL